MPILNSPAIEHIKNKAFFQNVQNHWDNLMLCCTYCNSRKPKKIIKLYNYYWPHLQNTFLAFGCNGKGEVIINNGLESHQLLKARNTINLYGLDKIVDNNGGIDSRHEARLTAISQAFETLKEYQNGATTLQSIIRNAQSAGFWSIWFTIFKNEPDVKRALIENFAGTAKNCFDNNLNPIPRNNNDL